MANRENNVKFAPLVQIVGVSGEVTLLEIRL